MAFFDVPDDWNGEDWACYQLEWPASAEWRAIFNALVRMTTWYRNFDSTSGDVAAAVAIGDEIWRRWRLEGGQSDVGCNNAEIVAALQAIAAGGVGAGGCGCGSNGAGGSGVAPNPLELGPGEYPEDFDSEAEYLSYKCNIATWIVANLDIDMDWYQSLTGVEILALEITGLALTLLTPVPFDDLIAIIALAVTILGYSDTVFDVISESIEDDYDNHICALYSANSAAEAYNQLTASLSAAIDSHTGDTFTASLAKQFLFLHISYDAINQLFTNELPYNDGYGGDCSECTQPECGWFLAFGTGTIVTDGSSFTITSELDTDYNYHRIYLLQTTLCCPTEDTLEVVSWTSSPNDGFNVYEWGGTCPELNRIVYANSPQTGTWSAAAIFVTEASTAQFTMTFKITA